jgi:V/A-type H+-transporting ATPase subunit A
VRLVGVDALSGPDRLLMDAAKMIREDFLHQNAFVDEDTYTSLKKQHRVLRLILRCYHEARQALEAGAELDELIGIKAKDDIARAKLIHEDKLQAFDELEKKVSEEIDAVGKADAAVGAGPQAEGT